MSYLLKSKPPRKHFLKKATLIIFVFCFFMLLELFFTNAVIRISHTIAKPLWFGSNFLTKPLYEVKNFFTSKNELIKKNLELENEIMVLKLKEIDYNLLSKEFDELKNQFGREADSRVVARILSRPPQSPYDTLVIDLGSLSGVLQDSKVYISENIIIGLVKEITPNTSLVELFSSGNKKQEAAVSRTGSSYILNGLGGGNFVLEVPKDTDIIWGDVFLYPEFSPSILGTVYYIDSSSQSSFKKIYIRVPGNIFSNKYVFIKN